jgi:hypothetical protein
MAAAMEPHFPMYVMEAAKLLDQQRLEPHQTLLQRGLIRKFNPDTDLFVIFGSHQWTADTEPDHTGLQLQTLQGAIRRMVNGDLSVVGDDFGTRAAGAAAAEKLTASVLKRKMRLAGILQRGASNRKAARLGAELTLVVSAYSRVGGLCVDSSALRGDGRG